MLELAKGDVKALIASKIYCNKVKYNTDKSKNKNKNTNNSSNSGNSGNSLSGNNGSNSNSGGRGDTDGMGPGGLIEGWAISEEMLLETLNMTQDPSLALKMLRSDFILDLTENVFKHQK